MTDVKPAQPDQADLAAWFAKVRELAKLKVEEHFLRLKLFNGFFPNPREGTNTHVLPDNYQLKGTHVITRKVMEEGLQALAQRPQIGVEEGTNAPIWGKSKLEEAGIDVSSLIKWEPTLSVTVYRTLTKEQMLLVDQMLLIKDGSPQLKIDPPAKPRGGKAKPTPDAIKPEDGIEE